MSLLKKYNARKILLSCLWALIGIGCVFLLVAAIHKKDERKCKGIEINIHGVHNNFFIDQKDITAVVEKFAGNRIKGAPIASFNLVAMEQALKKEIWISRAELFFDNNDILQAEVHEREPVARVFTLGGSSFYIDSTDAMLPLSDKLSARVPVFTGFPTELKVLSKPDSALLHDIKNLSMYLQRDSFMMAMIDQIAVTHQRQFEMIPKVGDQLIVFGDTRDMEQKFHKLRMFYKKVIPVYGWNRYHVVNLQYKGQIVTRIRGAEDTQADSLRTLQMMQAIASYTAKMASDSTQTIVQDNDRNSTDISLILQSIQRDEIAGQEYEAMDMPVQAPAVTAPVVAPAKPLSSAVPPAPKKQQAAPVKPAAQVKKPAVSKPAPKKVEKNTKVKPAASKPKVVMPSKNEY